MPSKALIGCVCRTAKDTVQKKKKKMATHKEIPFSPLSMSSLALDGFVGCTQYGHLLLGLLHPAVAKRIVPGTLPGEDRQAESSLGKAPTAHKKGCRLLPPTQPSPLQGGEAWHEKGAAATQWKRCRTGWQREATKIRVSLSPTQVHGSHLQNIRCWEGRFQQGS